MTIPTSGYHPDSFAVRKANQFCIDRTYEQCDGGNLIPIVQFPVVIRCYESKYLDHILKS